MKPFTPSRTQYPALSQDSGAALIGGTMIDELITITPIIVIAVALLYAAWRST
jgi:hypothetical protein